LAIGLHYVISSVPLSLPFPRI